MSNGKLLVIEDVADIREMVCHNLRRGGFTVESAANGEQGMQMLQRGSYSLVLLDLMLPGMDGLEVLKRIRATPEMKQTRVLIVTAKDDETDVVLGLELGADDYIVKPFSVKVLQARVRALLRRAASGDEEPKQNPVAIGTLSVDPARHEVTVAGERIDLTLAEFRILHNLACRPGRVLTRNQLLDMALGQDHFVLDRTIDVHVSSLRRKLGPAGDMIETVRGVGYRFKDRNDM